MRHWHAPPPGWHVCRLTSAHSGSSRSDHVAAAPAIETQSAGGAAGAADPSHEASVTGTSIGSERAATWNALGADDSSSVVARYMQQQRRGAGGADDSDATAEDKKRKAGGAPASAPSVAHKRLAAVNTSGMRTMQSFFKR